MIMYFKGQKSGKDYHVPVGYLRQDGTLLTVSSKERTWWRNFRCDAPVKVLVQGKLLPAHTCAFEDEATVEEGLKAFMKDNPRMVQAFKVNTGPDGQLDEASLRNAVSQRVIVRTTLE